MIITGKKFSKPSLSRVINGDDPLPEAPTPASRVRLDVLLTKLYPQYNRASAQVFIKSGFVKVNGVIVQKPGTQVIEADTQLELNIPEATWPDHPEPQVIYEDENVLVLNKPEGLLSVSKTGYCPEVTLEHYGLVAHRLDRGTSGVIILAKDHKSLEFLQKQFQQRKAHKTYYAIVEGQPKLPEALIDIPLARNPHNPTSFQVDPMGKPSQTYYRVVTTLGMLSLLELHPITGRTHQLRVHLSYLGTPILGDPLYGKHKLNSRRHRLYLHATILEITIPPHGGASSAERRVFIAPIPPEFHQILPNVDDTIDLPPPGKIPTSSNYSTLHLKSQEETDDNSPTT